MNATEELNVEPTEKLSMIIPISGASILVHQKRGVVAQQFGVDIKAVLVPLGENFLRQTSTEISSGSALEVYGNKKNVLDLYVEAITDK